jgi:hypothetical protein
VVWSLILFIALSWAKLAGFSDQEENSALFIFAGRGKLETDLDAQERPTRPSVPIGPTMA